MSLATLAVSVLSAVSGQLPFPPNWEGAPTGAYRLDAYPYPGQCATSASASFPTLPACTLASARSFACEPSGSGFANQTAGGWAACGSVVPPALLRPVDATTQLKFQWEALNPPDFRPDTTRFLNADYYEIAVHEAWGFQAVAAAGLFPNPLLQATCGAGGASACTLPVPDGMQWTGLLCTTAGGCTCPAGLAAAFAASYCSAAGRIPVGAPLFTPVWGVGQKNMKGGPVTAALKGAGLFKAPASRPEWSPDDFVATWPSISLRGTMGRPVVVKWINELPNNHLFCPHPEAADWPCGIDRTFMGVKHTIDPATAPPTFQLAGIRYDGVNAFGGPQQPDNSWVTHFHGGEIPPQTDGFAEKWFGNYRTGRYYSPQPWLLNPAFDAPLGALEPQRVLLQYGAIFRPGGNPAFSQFNGESSWMYDTYAYPMVNQEALLWFHGHALGKTHHDVIAGPAGFFVVRDPRKHGTVVNGACAGGGASCAFTWIDPVTEPRDALGAPRYDLFFVVQDRAFNDDGSLAFPNGMDQALPLPVATPAQVQDPATWDPVTGNAVQSGLALAPGTSPVTPGSNPQVHPTWVPEYLCDHALVNGVLWPKKTVARGWYRVRFVNGSDSRCWNLTFGTAQGTGNGLGSSARGFGTQGPGESGIQVVLVATEQGYLRSPVVTDHVTTCPGERHELLVDFSQFAPGTRVYVNNNAAAPFVDGPTPQDPGSPFTELATVMRFDVTGEAGVPSCAGSSAFSWPVSTGTGCLAIPAVTNPDPDLVSLASHPIAARRVLYLNERIDGVTGAPLGLQINGVPFEYQVTEIPKKGTWETWHVVNLTGDVHPIHPHLAKFQILRREALDVGCYLTLLCGSPTCQPGTAPGGVPGLTPDYEACLTGGPTFYPGNGVDPSEQGWKDVMRSYPGEVLTFVGRWDGSWTPQSTSPNAPGAGNASNPGYTFYRVGAASPKDARSWTYPEVTQGPYVWHCHINSHEDSEMMRSSLVLK